jgi:hypothetical protein
MRGTRHERRGGGSEGRDETSCARRRRAGQSRGSRARADRPSEARLPVCSLWVTRSECVAARGAASGRHGRSEEGKSRTATISGEGGYNCYACRLRTSVTLRRHCACDAVRLLLLVELVSWHEPPPQHSHRTRARSQSIVHVPDSTDQLPGDGQIRGQHGSSSTRLGRSKRLGPRRPAGSARSRTGKRDGRNAAGPTSGRESGLA